MRIILTMLPGLWLCGAGCGANGLLNPAFVNTLTGGVVPVTPGPNAAFVFVRCVNETNQTVEFIVTIERSVLVTDDEGNFQVDENGQFVTRPERESARLFTLPDGGARELGTLFACGETPVTLVGLGENLLPTDRHISVGGGGATGAAGTGVTVPNLNPLQLATGNFNCGDTIIFEAFQSSNVAGNVAVQVFLLPGSEQPSIFSGPDTFANLAEFQAAQVREEEP